MVIRRAAELQAREAESSDEGIDENEVIRIGRELGLSTRHIHRALAEVGTDTEAEHGFLARFYGPGFVHASRTVLGSADKVAALMERYFVEREFLQVLRRMSDRLVFTRASGVIASMGRASSKIFSRAPLLELRELTMAVQDLEEGYSHITLMAPLRAQRTAAAATSIALGGSGTAFAAAALAIAVAPPAALVALPLLPASMFVGHMVHDNIVDKVQVQLESLLDRLEHGEITAPARRGGWT